MNWKDKATTLPLNHKTRSDCFTCGPKNTAVINHTVKGYSFLCFRCGESDFVSKGTQTLEELAKIRELNAQAELPVPIELPEDFTADIPLLGRLWLYSGSVTESQWKRHGFGWSEKWQRVVMPVYNGDQLVWFQARAVLDGQKPKYLNPTGDRQTIMFLSKPRMGADSNIITVVEDILSAVRVGNVTPACSMLGTKITTAQAAQLVRYDTVRTWLDNDRAGKQGAYNIRRLCGLATKVQNITTSRDPKCYSNSQIKEILNGTSPELRKPE